MALPGIAGTMQLILGSPGGSRTLVGGTTTSRGDHFQQRLVLSQEPPKPSAGRRGRRPRRSSSRSQSHRSGSSWLGVGDGRVGLCALWTGAGGNQTGGGRSRMKVPKGRPRIAQLASPNFIESRRDDRKCTLKSRILFRPCGAFALFFAIPTVETVGYFLPPLRGSKQGATEPAELGRLESRKNFVSTKNGTARFTKQRRCALSLSKKRARLSW
jgi:hypothetical protein